MVTFYGKKGLFIAERYNVSGLSRRQYRLYPKDIGYIMQYLYQSEETDHGHGQMKPIDR